MVPKAFEAGYPNTTGFRKVVKATIYIKKKDGMSDADFVEDYNKQPRPTCGAHPAAAWHYQLQSVIPFRP